MATLNTVFKKVFLEELQEEGFVKVKGSLYAAMQRALAETGKVMLSVFDKTVDLNSCAKLFMRYGQDDYERLMYLKVSNRAELEGEVKKLLQEEIFEAENRDNYQNISKEEYIANLPKNFGGYWKTKMANLDETLADSDKYGRAMEEMKCRKIRNTERLRSYFA